MRVTLPTTDQPVTPWQPRIDGKKAVGGAETVLIVEDQALVLTAARQVLERVGYTIHTAASGEQALAAFEGLVPPPDLLLADVVMPGQSGPELAEQLVAIRPELKVLFMSGYTEDRVLQAGVAAGEIQLLEKPFLPEELAARVRSVLD